MKRIIACILIGALLSLLFPSAFADTPEIVAVYAAADISGLPDESGDGEPDATILYCFDDDTYKQYIIRDGRCELYRQGRGDPAGGPGLGQAALIQIYKKEESETMPPTIPTEEEAKPVTEIGVETFDEGPDTGIKIDGYTKYSGGPVEYFLSAGDRIAVITPSALAGEAQTESVMAGALNVQLAGDAWYFGKKVEKPTIGDDIRPIERADIDRSCRLMTVTSTVLVVLGALARVGLGMLLLR